MGGHFLVLSLTLFVPLVSCFDIPEGCEVVDNFKVDPVRYDSLRFHAYVAESQDVFSASLTCAGSDNEYLTLTANHSLTLETAWENGEYSERVISKKYPLQAGWQSFNLKLRGHYALEDDGTRSWKSPEGNDLKCEVLKVEVTNGKLMRHCPENIPTWNVKGNLDRSIPFVGDKLHVEGEKLKLYSWRSFSPIFTVEKILLQVGLANGKLKVTEEEELEPLTPFIQHDLSIYITKEYNGFKAVFSMAHGKSYSIHLKSELPNLTIRGQAGEEFVIIQELKSKKPSTDEEETSTTDKSEISVSTSSSLPGVRTAMKELRTAGISSPNGMTMGLGSVLGVCLIIILGLMIVLVYICRKGKASASKGNNFIMAIPEDENQCTGEGESATVTGRKKHDSMYLQPLACGPPELPPLPRQVLSCQMIYELNEKTSRLNEDQEPIYENPQFP